jgi:hypothetical protein
MVYIKVNDIYIHTKEASFTFPIPSFIYMFVLFHLKLALVGADTHSQLVLVIMFTYNKYVVIDTVYV